MSASTGAEDERFQRRRGRAALLLQMGRVTRRARTTGASAVFDTVARAVTDSVASAVTDTVTSAVTDTVASAVIVTVTLSLIHI